MTKAIYARMTQPKAVKNYSVFQDAATDAAEISIYDEIGFWGINAKDFIADLKNITAKIIHLRINSPGGSVIDANAMYNALREKKAKIITHVDALAASAASYLALAGDEVYIAKNAYFMIHDPWSMAIGPAEDLRKEADILDKMTTTLVDMYAAETGNSHDLIREKMKAETWFTADEAVAFGLADAIKDDNAKAAALFDTSMFKNMPSTLKRQIENSLRDAGMSRREAKAALTDGFDPDALRDAAQTDQQRDAEMAEIIKKLISAFQR
jgi:ATP-dependent Clp protease protease subunit